MRAPLHATASGKAILANLPKKEIEDYIYSVELSPITLNTITDVQVLHKIAKPPKKEKWGSLKSLEKVLATIIEPDAAHIIVAPLFAAYDMRLRDAHLPSNEILETFHILEIDPNTNPIFQGFQLLHRFVSCLYEIAGVLDA